MHCRLYFLFRNFFGLICLPVYLYAHINRSNFSFFIYFIICINNIFIFTFIIKFNALCLTFIYIHNLNSFVNSISSNIFFYYISCIIYRNFYGVSNNIIGVIEYSTIAIIFYFFDFKNKLKSCWINLLKLKRYLISFSYNFFFPDFLGVFALSNKFFYLS